MDTLQWIKEVAPIVETLAVVIGVGWGLKLAKQAIQTKEATIQQKEATIEFLDKFRSAPLAAELEAVTKTLNEYVGKKRQLEEELKSVTSTMKEKQRATVGLAFLEGFMAIEEIRVTYLTARGGLNLLTLPSKMKSAAEEFFKQGQRAVTGQELEFPRLKEVFSRQKT